MIESEYKTAVLAASKAWLDEQVFRGDDYPMTFVFHGVDYSAASFAGQLRLNPDAAGAPVAAFSGGSPSFVGGNTTVIFTLTDTQTDDLPAATETGRIAKLYMDFKITAGGLTERFAAGVLTVIGKVTP